MTGTLVIITLFLWLLLLLSGPVNAVLPLYGLYPGEMAAGEPNYYPRLMVAWAIAMGTVFTVLGLVALVRSHRPTAFAFAGLFLFSMVVFYVRSAEAMRHL